MKTKDEYLNENIFYGLTNLNDGFDSLSIKYFSTEEFEVILKRIKKSGLGIFGIEAWKNGEFYLVSVNENSTSNLTDSKWYMKIFEDFRKEDSELQYSATYFVPDEVLS